MQRPITATVPVPTPLSDQSSHDASSEEYDAATLLQQAAQTDRDNEIAQILQTKGLEGVGRGVKSPSNEDLRKQISL